MEKQTGNKRIFYLLGHPSRAGLPNLLITLISLLAILPACSKGPTGVGESLEAGWNIHTKVHVKSSGSIPPAGLDIFVFKDGAVKSLDSYCRQGYGGAGIASVVSGSGDRLVAMISGARLRADQIASVHCYEDLESLYVSLEDEASGSPVMSGETVICAGTEGPWNIVLEPLLSKVEVVGLSVKLKGQYAGKRLTNVQAYLINVNGSCQPLRRDGFRPVEIFNSGRLRESDLGKMSSPQLLNLTPRVSREMDGEVTYETFSLYCYPNDVLEESSGSPFTRLVIQGEIDGQTYYYPVPINRPGYGYAAGKQGVCRNVNYVMDIHISRPGSLSPDEDMQDSGAVTQGSATLYPGDFITGSIGDRFHIWCDVYPQDTPVELDYELLEGDRLRGIYDYTVDSDGHGVQLVLTGRGTGMVYMEAGGIVGEAFLCVIVVR
jgi:hypothetical protein